MWKRIFVPIFVTYLRHKKFLKKVFCWLLFLKCAFGRLGAKCTKKVQRPWYIKFIDSKILSKNPCDFEDDKCCWNSTTFVKLHFLAEFLSSKSWWNKNVWAINCQLRTQKTKKLLTKLQRIWLRLDSSKKNWDIY